MYKNNLIVMLSSIVLVSNYAYSKDTAVLAKKLANPISALISLPIQANYDGNYGPTEKGSVWKTNVQPVIPFSISEHWNVISRTIIPIIDQNDKPLPGDNASGLGDITQSFFFSPKAPTSNGWIWGVGPVILADSASDDDLGSEQWAAGPTAVGLRQEGAWTYGMLANHVESLHNNSDKPRVSATFLQPFLAYIIDATKTTISMNTESTYDWNSKKWSVPLNAGVYQMFKIGNQIMQGGVGTRYWAESPAYAADGWGARIQLTFLFPK